MKKLAAAISIALGMGAFGLANANGNGESIVGSPHDFSDKVGGTANAEATWNYRGEICRVCHVPHDHKRDLYTNGLLWNHQISSATYTMYNSAWSSTIEGTQDTAPTGTAKLCLGCHDGSVGIDSFDGHTSSYTPSIFLGAADQYDSGFEVPGPLAENNLTGTHPISIAFPAGQTTGTNPEFNDPATATWASGATVASTLDKNGKVQCSTCHDVHNQESVANTHLLRTGQTAATGTASGLCLTCHIK